MRVASALPPWNRYHQGFSAHTVVNMFTQRGKPRLSLKKLVVEWGALGLQVWVFGRRGKIRRGDPASARVAPGQVRHAAHADGLCGAEVRRSSACGPTRDVEAEFGAAPKRPKYWYDRDPVVRESLRKLREERELGEIPKASQG